MYGSRAYEIEFAGFRNFADCILVGEMLIWRVQVGFAIPPALRPAAVGRPARARKLHDVRNITKATDRNIEAFIVREGDFESVIDVGLLNNR